MIPRFSWSLPHLIVGIVMLLVGSDSVAATSSVSPEGFFVLSSAPSRTTTRFSRTLSGYEKQFLKLTDYKESPFPPIVVVLHGSMDAVRGATALSMDALEGGKPKIQVDITEQELPSARANQLLAQAMLLREYYGDTASAPGSHIAEFPAWLIHGLGRLCDPNAHQVVIPLSFLQGATPPSIEDLLVQKAPDGSNQSLAQIYDAMSSTLLSAGLQHPDSGSVFRDWIGHFDPNSPAHELSSWPAGWPMPSVERRWLLLMAGTTGEDTGMHPLLGVAESVNRYDALLADLPTPKHSLALLKKEKGAAFSFLRFSERLVALRLEVNPLSVPLLDGTIQICDRFKHLSEKKIVTQEKTLAVLREEILKRANSIEAYLDWYEAAKLPVSSGLFNHLLEIPETPLKKGPVGRALDAVEARGWQ